MVPEVICPKRVDKQKLRVAFNDYGFEFVSLDGRIDAVTCEGEVLDIYRKKHDLNTVLLNQHEQWGGFNETTGRWDGMFGAVSIF